MSVGHYPFAHQDEGTDLPYDMLNMSPSCQTKCGAAESH